jgi:hypothetical protein
MRPQQAALLLAPIEKTWFDAVGHREDSRYVYEDRMDPTRAVSVLSRLDRIQAADIMAEMRLDQLIKVLNRMDPNQAGPDRGSRLAHT